MKQKSKAAAKTPSRRPKVAMNRSIIPPLELGDRSPIAPGTSKKSVTGSSKTRKKLDVGSPEESAVDPPIPAKEAASSAVRKKPTPPSTKTASKPRSKNVVASKKAKGQSNEKSAATSYSLGEESPVGSAVPIPSSTMYDRTRSKRKAAVE